MEESADGRVSVFGGNIAMMVKHWLRRREEILWFSRAVRRRKDLWMEFLLSYFSFTLLMLKVFRVFQSMISLLRIRMIFMRGENEIKLYGRGRSRTMCKSHPPPPPQGIHLPLEIMLNIFSRLPVESVLECRRVCKIWKNLLMFDDNYFAHMHLQQHHQRLLPHWPLDDGLGNFENLIQLKVSFLFFGRHKSFYYLEYDENDKQSYNTFTRINLKLPIDTASMVGSCNGLVCLAVKYEENFNICDPIYICNPITRECVNLPRLVVNNEHKVCKIVHDFGYHHSTNEYKVVRIHYLENQPCVGRVHVYTLGSGRGWRDKGEITYSISCISKRILLNGSFHWLDREDGKILAFNLADEEFRVLPSPPCLKPRDYSTGCELRVLGGRLCVVKETSWFSADIWSLKRKKCISSYDVMKEHEYHSWSWNREVTLEVPGISTRYVPFAITSNGEILLWGPLRSIVCYDPKTAIEKDIGNLHKDLRHYEPIVHLNSFVSLEALGENTTILGLAESK